ncbi:nicotinate-nucleotide--dimethylbenzimidazole phosphoribosyltransferase [Streptomyces sp. NPDC032940]|uniref:nicotinate-nucleotide--dimethylbenzimidazole phosphoribosyltransferase n=1 Tax=Streptomyces sp. NPDC032940 TaxID=3155366 RepID=UPI0033F401D9
MTDTGQIPGEGLPENAGMVEQPGVPAPGAYTYLSETTAEDEDLLLLPGAQSAWGNEVAPPAPEPVVETVHQPGPHELSGRDSGSVDLGGVRLPEPPAEPVAAPVPPRRPLHLGPPIPDTSASPVRSLADRGPAAVPVRHAGPPTVGPEYLDVPQAAAMPPQPAAPWGAQTAPSGAGAPAAETVVPVPDQRPEPVGAAQALVARVATEAVAATGGVPAPDETGAVGASETEGAAEAEGAAENDGVPGAGDVSAEAAAHEPAAPAVEAPASDSAPAAEPAAVVEAQAPPSAPVPEAALPESAPAPEPVVAESVPVAEAVAEPVAEAAPGPVAGETAEAVSARETGEAQPGITEPAPAEPAPDADAPASEVPAPEPTPVVETPAPAPGVAEPPVAEEPGTVTEPTEAPAPRAVEQTPSVEPAPLAEVPEQAPPAEPASPAEPAAPAEAVAEHVAPTADAEPSPAPQSGPAGEPAPENVQAPAVPEPSPVAPADPTAAPVTAVAEKAEEAAAVQDHPAQPHPEVPQPAQGPQSVPDQPVGRFVPVDGGQVPTTPHLAPTPPEPLVLPAEALDAPARDAVADVPAPREADAGLVQNADDLDTRDAGQDDQEDPHVSTATEADVRQPAGPAAPAYDDAEREAVLKVMRERRDIRNGFRSDPIPHEVLLRVLEAAHTAPSVGHSQPWDFVVIRSADTRRAMHELATRQREAYAKSLPKGRAKQFKELKIEAILDTPVNIVVTADPTRGGRHTLGRHTQPQMAPYSSALAVENLWLAARAEGLGVGWVSFFDEREMVRALGLPEHLEVVAYLCVGYVDEFPDEPELMQAGWSKRRPLSWVVHEETYGRRALPGEAPHDLLAETVAQIRPLDAKALGEAWERQKRMTKPAGALGMLEIISAQLSGLSRQCPPPIPEPAAVAVFAGDHGVHAQGVTPWPQEVTAQMVANFLGGGAVCNAFAAQVGAEVCVVDVGVAADLPATPGLLPRKVRAGTSDMTTGPAMTREEAAQAIEVGIETARDLVAAGNKALLTGEMGIANTTASAALISVFTGADPAEVTGRGTGINDETLARKTEVVRRALELHQPDPADPIGVLAAIGGFEHAAMVGLLLGGASLRTPVILDGVSAGAAALVARAIAPEVLAACIAGHRSAEPGHVAALNKLGLRPLVDLDLRLGEGTGALLALPMVQSTARAMHEVATFDSAGVTEK